MNLPLKNIWRINIMCPKCRHVGDLVEDVPDNDSANALCGAAFLQGQLLGALRRIEREGNDCCCGYSPCGCGTRMAWIADDLCDLLAEVAP